MPSKSATQELINRLSDYISSEVGNIHQDDLGDIGKDFDKILQKDRKSTRLNSSHS